MKYRIIVSEGIFSSPEYAANAEKEVNWQDETGAKECTECFCAYDVAETLRKIKHLEAEVVSVRDFSREQVSEKDVLVVIGSSAGKEIASAYSLPFIEEELGDSGFRMSGRTVDGIGIVFLYGSERRGTLYAGAAYMERHGIRFVTPEESGTVYCEALDRSQEAEFDVVELPSFKTRGVYSGMIYDSSYEFLLWAAHNRMNYVRLHKLENPERVRKLGLSLCYGGHQLVYEYMDINHEYPYKHKLFGGDGKPDDPYPLSPLVRADKKPDGILTYGQAHPEWYPLVDGKRRLYRDYKNANEKHYHTGDYICTSNEDATDEYVRLLVDALADGDMKFADYLHLAALDNGTWCTCEKCQQQSQTYSYRQLMLAYKLDKAIKKATAEGRIGRKIHIDIPAYHETLTAPDKPLPEDFDYDTISVVFFVIERCFNHNIDDPICEETNQMLIGKLRPWLQGNYRGEMMIGEYYNVSKFGGMPFIFTERMKNDIPFYYRSGARHLHYMHFLARKWGVCAVNNYLYVRLLWDVNADADKVIAEYFRVHYGKYGDAVREILLELEKVTGNCKYWRHYQYIHSVRRSLTEELNRGEKNIFGFQHIGLDSVSDSPQAGLSLRQIKDSYREILDKFGRLVKEAGGDCAELFAEDMEQLEFGMNSIEFIYHVAKYTVTQDAEEKHALFDNIKEYADKLEKTTGPFAGYDRPYFRNGFQATCLQPAYERIAGEMEP